MLWVLGALALLVSLPVAGVLWMTSVPGRSHEGPLPPLTSDQLQLASRLQDHVQAVASRPHNVEHPEELERAARYIERALTELGYGVRRQPFQAGSYPLAWCRMAGPRQGPRVIRRPRRAT